MKHFPSKRSMAASWQAHLKNLASLNRLVPQRIASDDPPYDEDPDRYAFMLRRRERWLGR